MSGVSRALVGVVALVSPCVERVKGVWRGRHARNVSSTTGGWSSMRSLGSTEQLGLEAIALSELMRARNSLRVQITQLL